MVQQSWYLITGADSVGKTTTIGRLHEYFSDLARVNMRMNYNGYPAVIFVPEVARRFIEGGLDSATQEFQSAVIQKQIEIEVALSKVNVNSVIICDRSLPDAYAYSTLQGLETGFDFDYLDKWMQRYTHAFVLSTENTMRVDDGVRNLKGPERTSIEKEILQVLETTRVPHSVVLGPPARRYLEIGAKLRADIDKDFMGRKGPEQGDSTKTPNIRQIGERKDNSSDFTFPDFGYSESGNSEHNEKRSQDTGGGEHKPNGGADEE